MKLGVTKHIRIRKESGNKIPKYFILDFLMPFIKFFHLWTVALLCLILSACLNEHPNHEDVLHLEGSWLFQLDRHDAGIDERWFADRLSDRINLPGSLQEQGFGDEISIETPWTGSIIDKSWFTESRYAPYRKTGNIKIPFWLQPDRYYKGAAWYQKEIQIPASWKNKRITLFLERCHWETRLWADEICIGARNSLAAPHIYDLSETLGPGLHRLTIRVDNRMIVDVGANAHSISDHTQTNWNGMIGKLELRTQDPLCIDDIQIFPDIKKNELTAEIQVISHLADAVDAVLSLSAHSLPSTQIISQKSLPVVLESGKNNISIRLSLKTDADLWDEFHPDLCRFNARLQAGSLEDSRSLQFGWRDFKTAGRRFSINGRPIFLRGTLECAIFPRTGYPEMREKEWLRIFQVCKSHGLNHMRFHSWCPPEAAFSAADKSGIYLHVECGAWTEVGSGKPFDEWLYEESGRIVREFGNHPSFCMMAYGNEPSGENQQSFLGEFVSFWKAKDPRRLYTSAAGWPLIPESDFLSTYEPRIQLWGAGLSSPINAEPPQTLFDYHDIIQQYDRPVVSHEIGQWCVFPNFAEIPKYDGILKAKNFEIFRETLENNHMGDLAADFLLASGKLQALCYKADIEAALRTHQMAGFQLLDLHDFPGQGTALVGVLDPFWEEKGYIKPEEFRQFCGPTVPLARLARRTFLQSEMFTADIEAAHFGEKPLEQVEPEWMIRTPEGQTIAGGKLPAVDIPIGNGFHLGTVEWSPEALSRPERFNLTVRISEAENTWAFWVYPETSSIKGNNDVLETSSLNEETIRTLARGGTVFLTIPPARLRPEKGARVGLGFSPIFWNTAWTRNQKPHTLGILCDPDHAALRDFPTEFHSNWQWWEVITKAKPMLMDGFPPKIRPLVRVIDDWFTNRRLGLVFEARAGGGKLLVSSIDFSGGMKDRPALRQLYHSLKTYTGSSDFQPLESLPIQMIKELSKPPSPLDSAMVISSDSERTGYEAALVLDDDPHTFWHTPWEEEVPGYPHELIIDFGKILSIEGCLLTPRQDGNTGGFISRAAVYLSVDGRVWGNPVSVSSFEANMEEKPIAFSDPVSARFLKLEALEGFDDQPFASLAELNVIVEESREKKL